MTDRAEVLDALATVWTAWDTKPGSPETAAALVEQTVRSAPALGVGPLDLVRRVQEARRALPGCAIAVALAAAFPATVAEKKTP